MTVDRKVQWWVLSPVTVVYCSELLEWSRFSVGWASLPLWKATFCCLSVLCVQFSEKDREFWLIQGKTRPPMVTEIVTKLSNRAFCPTYKNVFACKIPIFGSEIFIFMLLNQIATLVYWYICSLLACIAVLVYLRKDAFLPVLRAHRTGCIVCIRATGGGSDRWVGVS